MKRMIIGFVAAFATSLSCMQTTKTADIRPLGPDPTPTPTQTNEVFARKSPIVFKGTYTNVRTDGEHQWGYSISIWEQGENFLGIASGSDDLLPIGDPPRGILEDVKYEARSGNISFRASLKTNEPRSKIRSRTIESIVFRGKLKESNLTGELSIINEQCGPPCKKARDVVLNFSKELSSVERDFADFSDWNGFVKEIMGSD